MFFVLKIRLVHRLVRLVPQSVDAPSEPSPSEVSNDCCPPLLQFSGREFNVGNAALGAKDAQEGTARLFMLPICPQGRSSVYSDSSLAWFRNYRN
jgi:hypothetical protein